MSILIQKAVKEKLSCKIALEGPAGSGKTYSALLLAKGFGGKTCLIDTENRSSRLYADKFEFDIIELGKPFPPEHYIEAIKAAEDAGYDNIIVDSATHEWDGEGGILDLNTELSKTDRSSFNVWGKLTPRHNKFIRHILDSKANIICCFRTKTAYEVQEQDRNGRKVAVPVKIGTKPVTREGFDYECTIVFVLAISNMAEVSKDRTGLYIGIQKKLEEADGKKIMEYLGSGATSEEIKAQQAVAQKEQEEARVVKGREWVRNKWFNMTSPPLIGPEADQALDAFVKEFHQVDRFVEVELKHVEVLYKLLNNSAAGEKTVKNFVDKWLKTRKDGATNGKSK